MRETRLQPQVTNISISSGLAFNYAAAGLVLRLEHNYQREDDVIGTRISLLGASAGMALLLPTGARPGATGRRRQHDVLRHQRRIGQRRRSRRPRGGRSPLPEPRAGSRRNRQDLAGVSVDARASAARPRSMRVTGSARGHGRMPRASSSPRMWRNSTAPTPSANRPR